MLTNLFQNIRLDQKREEAKAKIDQLLAPIWSAQEAPRISDLESFRRLAEPLWKSTGIGGLGELLTQETVDRPLFEVSLEINQLKSLSDFAIGKLGVPWANWSSAIELPQVDWWPGISPPLLSLDSIGTATEPHGGAALWESLIPSATEKIRSYANELAVVLGAFEASDGYTLTIDGGELDQRLLVEAYARRRAYVQLKVSSYVSRLLYLRSSIVQCLASRNLSESPLSSFLFYSTKESCKITPHVLKRPPPPSTLP